MSFEHASIEKKEIIKIISPPIIVIHGKNELIMKRFNIADIKTIIRKKIFVYQTLIYHSIKSFSAWLNNKSDLILFFTNGAKNITPAIADSLASDEMISFSVSILKV